MKTLKELNVINKKVLVRCDFNVPLDKEGNILDDFKIKKMLPTINYLIGQKSKIILMSHLGRPEGKVVPELKLDKVAERLAEYLNISIAKEDDCIGVEVENQSNQLDSGKILMLENLRFHKEETENSVEFAKKLSFLGEIYVNDAFSVCHRENASVAMVSQFLPSCMGLLLEKEITTLDKIMTNPERPLVVIVGGVKVQTKVDFIDNISEKADYVVVGGLIAKEAVDKNIIFRHPEKIIIPEGQLDAPDVNEESIKKFQEIINKARTILWNGPLGKFEEDAYSKGTLAIAEAIINSKAFSIVGGGETVEFLNKHGMIDKLGHVSTGGGAMLSYLAGGALPGIMALG